MPKLKNVPTIPHKSFSQTICEKDLETFHQKLFDLQNKFYADGRYGLLIIFQGLDTSGKDGSIRHVMSCMNPMGVHVKPFKKPTEEELEHDFLWRIYPHLPAKRMISVFNRSYYEDLVVPLANKQLSDKAFEQRCELINTLEKHLKHSQTHVLKFFLHISEEEERNRIEERKTEPHKLWKYAKEDELVADNWSKYVEIYDSIFENCQKPDWNIIPADKRWYRNYAVAKILTKYLESLDLEYPKQLL